MHLLIVEMRAGHLRENARASIQKILTDFESLNWTLAQFDDRAASDSDSVSSIRNKIRQRQ